MGVHGDLNGVFRGFYFILLVLEIWRMSPFGCYYVLICLSFFVLDFE